MFNPCFLMIVDHKNKLKLRILCIKSYSWKTSTIFTYFRENRKHKCFLIKDIILIALLTTLYLCEYYSVNSTNTKSFSTDVSQSTQVKLYFNKFLITTVMLNNTVLYMHVSKTSWLQRSFTQDLKGKLSALDRITVITRP